MVLHLTQGIYCVKFAYLPVIGVLCLKVRSSYSAFVFDLVRHRFKKCNRVKITSELQLLPIQKCSNLYSSITYLQLITSNDHFRASIIYIITNHFDGLELVALKSTRLKQGHIWMQSSALKFLMDVDYVKCVVWRYLKIFDLTNLIDESSLQAFQWCESTTQKKVQKQLMHKSFMQNDLYECYFILCNIDS